MKHSKLLNSASSFFSILYVLCIITIAIYVIFFVAGLFYPELLDKFCPYELPIKIKNYPIKLTDGKVIQLTIKNYWAQLETGGAFSLIAYTTSFIMLAGLIVSLYFLHVINVLIDGAKSGNPFTVKVFSKLKKAAIFSLVIGIAYWMNNVFSQYYIYDKIDVSSIESMKGVLSVKHNIGDLIGSFITPLIIIVVAEIFKQGAKLKEEQESFI